MLQETMIYGTSFHRVWSLRTHVVDTLDFAVGRLSGSTLTIEDVHRCDDESDVLVEILSSASASASASWGLDFPFSLPDAVYRDFSLRDWPALLKVADALEKRNSCRPCRQREGERGRVRPPRSFRRVVRARRRDRAPAGGRSGHGRERHPVHRRRDQSRYPEERGPRDAETSLRYARPARGADGRRKIGATGLVAEGIRWAGPDEGRQALAHRRGPEHGHERRST